MCKPNPVVEIPPEIEAEMTPSVKAFVLAAFGRFEVRIATFEQQLQKRTPRDSLVPPNTEHPQGNPRRKPLTGIKRKRDFQKLIDSSLGQVRRMGSDLMRQHRELFGYCRW